MSENKQKPEKVKRFTFLKLIGILFTVFLIVVVSAGSVVMGTVASVLKSAPDIDVSNINASLSQTSTIYDKDGNLLEKIQTSEYRTIVGSSKMPKFLKDAFISIEDERFEHHPGIDLEGIAGAIVNNFKSGSMKRGASTITQQLVKNLYLKNERKLSRKLTEAYLSLQMERKLSKDQILELYLNRISLGQNAFGVQEAAQTYFSKNVEDLTLAECALFAGIVQAPTTYAPYLSISPKDFDPSKDYEVGRVDAGGEKLIAVYNPKSVERQHVVLAKMKELGKISEEEYQSALKEDIKTSLKPGQKTLHDMSSYFTDYVIKDATKALAELRGTSFEQAQNELLTSGLKIYSTVDVNMQHKLEDIYKNFTNLLKEGSSGPNFINWHIDGSGNIIDKSTHGIIYFKKENIFDGENRLIIPAGCITDEGSKYAIKANFLYGYPTHIDIGDVYTINENNNLVVHVVGSIKIPEEYYSVDKHNVIRIDKTYLNKNTKFAVVDGSGNMVIPTTEFYYQVDGSLQPQSASVIMDYHTGQILAMVGGREVEVNGRKLLNRATDSARQPGSSMKPIGAYLPALAEGLTAATTFPNEPIMVNGSPWPRNWNGVYGGMMTLRKALEQSNNVVAVRTVQKVGIEKSMEYLQKLGLINPDHPEEDNIVTARENPVTNDENLSALALGGMTKGLTPLEMTAAYAAIANDGVYIKPISFTKILDRNGNILIDNTPKKTEVSSPAVAYVLKDMMRTTVTNGIAGSAAMQNYVVCGKTGTTTDNADIWFVGYTPYYVCGTWIGDDSPKISLANGSSKAIQLWKHIMTSVHEGKPAVTEYPRPEDVIDVKICTISGKRIGPYCERDPRGVVRSEIFVKGTEPQEVCDMHVEVEICTTSGKLAGEYCPPETREKRVMVRPPEGYVQPPLDENGKNPDAYLNYAPTEYCNIHTKEWAEHKAEEDMHEINDLISHPNDGNRNNGRHDGEDNDGNNESHDVNDLLRP